MQDCDRYKPGDVVIHARRPEWGEGVIDQAQVITHEGRRAQRLVIRFSHRGRVTINTAVALLKPKQIEGTMTNTDTPTTFRPSASGRGWLGSIQQKQDNGHELWSLPEAMTDPFASLTQRLGATLDSYRFGVDAHSLIEWAVAQTGLTDPLSKYNRHELEQAFARFARDRDRHLADLVATAKKQGESPWLARQIREARDPRARQALQKAVRG